MPRRYAPRNDELISDSLLEAFTPVDYGRGDGGVARIAVIGFANNGSIFRVLIGSCL